MKINITPSETASKALANSNIGLDEGYGFTSNGTKLNDFTRLIVKNLNTPIKQKTRIKLRIRFK